MIKTSSAKMTPPENALCPRTPVTIPARNAIAIIHEEEVPRGLERLQAQEYACAVVE